MAEQNRIGIGPRSLRPPNPGQQGGARASLAAVTTPQGKRWRPGPSAWVVAGLQLVLGLLLAPEMPGSRVGGGSSMGPPQLPQLRCPGGCAGALPPALVLQCSAPSEHLQIMAFSFLLCLFVYLFFAFFFFLAANFPLQMPWRKQDSAQEAAAPQGISVGHRVPRSLGWMKPQRTGTEQCLGEHTAAWDRQGKTRILQNEDKQELSSGACGGNGPRVCSHRCGGLAWLRQLRRTAAWPLR